MNQFIKSYLKLFDFDLIYLHIKGYLKPSGFNFIYLLYVKKVYNISCDNI